MIDRDLCWLVQTPQVFHLHEIQESYSNPWPNSFTDDASVLESYNKKIFITEGDRENIKITTPIDLQIAQVILYNRKQSERKKIV